MGVDTRARAIVLLIVTFVAGAIAGAAAWPYVEPRRMIRVGREVEAERIPAPLVGLGLSSDEEARLHTIPRPWRGRARARPVARHWRPRADSEFREVRRHVSDMENGMFAEMLCVLSPEKRERYLKLTQDEHYDPTVVEKRFALVRANKCGEVPR